MAYKIVVRLSQTIVHHIIRHWIIKKKKSQSTYLVAHQGPIWKLLFATHKKVILPIPWLSSIGRIHFVYHSSPNCTHCTTIICNRFKRTFFLNSIIMRIIIIVTFMRIFFIIITHECMATSSFIASTNSAWALGRLYFPLLLPLPTDLDDVFMVGENCERSIDSSSLASSSTLSSSTAMSSPTNVDADVKALLSVASCPSKTSSYKCNIYNPL